jgi:hypothetical protein
VGILDEHTEPSKLPINSIFALRIRLPKQRKPIPAENYVSPLVKFVKRKRAKSTL